MATIRELLISIDTQLNAQALREAEKKASDALKRAEREAEKALKAIEKKQKDAMNTLSDSTEKAGGLIKNVFLGLAVVIPTVTFAILKLNSEIAGMTARVGVFSGNMATAKDTLKELVNISKETGVGLGAVEETFGRLSLSAKALNVDTRAIIEVTRGIAQTMAVTGKPASEMAGALTQLGQAFASPIVQTEEFRSVLEGAPVLANEMAKSILGNNGNAGALLQLVKAQKLTNKAMFVAIQDALPRINKQFGAMPLTLDRVLNRFALMPVQLSMAFGDLEAPQKFLRVLDDLIVKTTQYLIKNKDLINSKITSFFDSLTELVNGLVNAYKTFEPVLLFLINNFNTLISILGGVLGAYVAIKVFLIAQLIPTAIKAGIAMATALGPVGLAITGLISLATFLELKFKLLSNAIKNIGDAWNAISSKLGKAGIRMSDFLERANRGELRMRGGRADQAEAQRQGAGGSSVNRTTTNNASAVVNVNGGGITPKQAERIGKSFAMGSLRGFQALETMA